MKIDGKKIHLVVNDLNTGAFEATTLYRWMHEDRNLWLKKTKPTKMSWVILRAYNSAGEATAEAEKLSTASP